MISLLRKTRTRPVRTFVALMKSLMGDCSETLEVYEIINHASQRIKAGRIELIGRIQPGHHVHRSHD